VSPDFVCLTHVRDAALLARLTDWTDSETECDICGALDAVDFSLITDVVHGAIGARFKRAQEWNAPWDEIESGEETTVYDVTELLDGELALFDAVDRELYEAIESSFGDDTMWVTTFEYDMRSRDKDLLGWQDFRALVEHKSRYLQIDEQSYVAEMYGVPSPRQMLKRVGRLLDRHGLYRRVDPGTRIWRGRVDDHRQPSWAGSELASAPPRFARQSRMSAAGISLFYGAFDTDTVAAELADDTRPYLMVGAFTPTRPLVLIDLTRLPEFVSPFAENAAQLDDELLFLGSFTADVSRAVTDPELVHVDYAPTQVVAEYLRYAFKPRATKVPVDGIVYRSSRCDGECVAVFADHSQCMSQATALTVGAPSLLRWASKRCKVLRHGGARTN
jgi:hypothetical protein